MARMRQPGWKACDEFKKRIKSRQENREGYEDQSDAKRGSGEQSSRPPRFKNLAQTTGRDRATVKANLKAMLPMLTSTQVRSHRIPHCDAVILSLEEVGFEDAAQYLKMLLNLDEETRVRAGPGTVVWKRPRLKNRNEFLDLLKVHLAKSNEAKKNGSSVMQATAMLEAALRFQRESSEWSWIAKQLFESALKLAESIESDDRQTVTMTRYLYGRFLFEDMKDPQEALDHLNEARESSQGKMWNASKLLGFKQENVFRESCNLLHKALLTLARQVRDENPELAVRACRNALKRATDSAHDAYIAEALYELGKSQFRTGESKQALLNFTKLLSLTTRIPDLEGICDAHMELAFTYKDLGDKENTMKHLRLFRESAAEFQLPYKLAQAHYYTGEHLLDQSHPQLATPHLEYAFTLYNDLCLMDEANQARSVMAVSKGQQVLDRYIDLTLKCGDYDQDATLKICYWKDGRVPFWTAKSETEMTSESVSEESIKGRSIPSNETLERTSDYSLSALNENADKTGSELDL